MNRPFPLDPAKYNNDLSECNQRRADFRFGPVISNCMEEKGYKIFEKRS
jgi:hypothetical protein